MEYTFNGSLAQIVGTDATSIFEYINYFVCFSKRNNKNMWDGKYWMLGNTQSINAMFGHLSEQQVNVSVATLIGMNIVVSCKDEEGHNWFAIGENGERFCHAV